ncbi:MAG: 5-(carboxyamino)imidazole ribonucleotide mutase [bacterium]
MARETTPVLILLGSDSDLKCMKKCSRVLEEFAVPASITVASAHRSPERTQKLSEEARANGTRVIIAAAGLAAHLAGVVASHTLLPVIGVPMEAGPFQGMDSLLSTVQMPPGVPVATVGVGDAGAKNAAFLALRILALSDQELYSRLETYRGEMAKQVESTGRSIEEGEV